MLVRSVSHSPIVLLAVLFIYTSAPQALADQVTLSYIDANTTAQTIVLDCNTSSEDLALAASLIGQEGVVIANDAEMIASAYSMLIYPLNIQNSSYLSPIGRPCIRQS